MSAMFKEKIMEQIGSKDPVVLASIETNRIAFPCTATPLTRDNGDSRHVNRFL